MSKSALDRVRRNFLIVLGLRWLSVGLIIPTLILAMQSRGLNLTQIGLVLATYSITVVLLELPTGGLADAMGRRPVLAVASATGAAGLVIFLFAQNTLAFIAAWVILGVGRALDSGALEAWFVDATQKVDAAADLQPGLSRAGVVTGLALAGGSLAGGFIPKLVPGLSEGGDAVLTELTVPALAALIVGLVHLISILFLVSESADERTQDSLRASIAEVPTVIKDGIGIAVRRPVVRALFLAMVTVGVTIQSIEALWQPRFAELLEGASGNTPLFGMLATAAFLAAAAGSSLSPWFSKWLKRRDALVNSGIHLVGGITLIGLAAVGGVVFSATLFVAVYVAIGAAGPLHNEMLHGQVSSEQRSTILSLDSLALQLGALVGTLILPAVAESAGIPVAWTIAGITLIVGGGFYLLIDRRAIVDTSSTTPGTSGS